MAISVIRKKNTKTDNTHTHTHTSIYIYIYMCVLVLFFLMTLIANIVNMPIKYRLFLKMSKSINNYEIS